MSKEWRYKGITFSGGRNLMQREREQSLYLCPDVSHGDPFLLRNSGAAGSRGFSPTALIFSFNWPVEEDKEVEGKVTKPA